MSPTPTGPDLGMRASLPGGDRIVQRTLVETHAPEVRERAHRHRAHDAEELLVHDCTRLAGRHSVAKDLATSRVVHPLVQGGVSGQWHGYGGGFDGDLLREGKVPRLRSDLDGERSRLDHPVVVQDGPEREGPLVEGDRNPL